MTQLNGSADARGPSIVPADVASAEAHHRIKNSLMLVSALVKMQEKSIERRSEKISPADVLSMLRSLSTKIKSIEAFHSMLSIEPNSVTVNLADYLRNAFGNLIGSELLTSQYELTEDYGADCVVDSEKAIPLTLIMVEAVSNAVKYAHPTGIAGTIGIVCRREESGVIVVCVADDGVGYPEGFSPDTGGGVGFGVVRALAKQIDAEILAISSPLGAKLEIRLAQAASFGAV